MEPYKETYQPSDKIGVIGPNSIPDQTQEIMEEVNPRMAYLFHGFALCDALNSNREMEYDILGDYEWELQSMAIQRELKSRGISRTEIQKMRESCDKDALYLLIQFDPESKQQLRRDRKSWTEMDLSKISKKLLVERQVFCRYFVQKRRNQRRKLKKNKKI
jgi:hypothetical protein